MVSLESGTDKSVMTTDPACVTLDDNVFSVLDTVRSAGVVRRLPVVNANHELLGVVSISDLAVIAKDLIEGVLLDETHTAMREAQILTGAKRMVKEIRRPTQLDKLPPEQGAPGHATNARGRVGFRVRGQPAGPDEPTEDDPEHGRSGRGPALMPAPPRKTDPRDSDRRKQLDHGAQSDRGGDAYRPLSSRENPEPTLTEGEEGAHQERR